ncbi:hypothetical protein CLV30_10896 [Haloactinopolyspora alba]|uniref:Membrane protein YgcG n=1 Tax=Haloactinopolyspora alba TaxID=648780 RepID=A0A2P8E135_9ACTN|nr:hypothetical protein [Haloactinopolyspora alba]PSL03184.1 hypothetical protein CLV30_10896 [Haloactinopolyspora alba]
MSGAYEEAAAELRDSGLYVYPAAERELADAGAPFDTGARADVRRMLSGAETPIFLVVVAQDFGQEVTLQGVANAVDEQGTYVAYRSDGQATASSTVLDRDAAREAAITASEQAFNVSEFVDDLVPRLESLADEGAGDSADSTGGGWVPLTILLAAGGGGFLLYRRNKRSKERAQLKQVRGALEEDITAYGEQLSALDLDVQTTSAVPVEARDEYGRALDLYERAKVFSDRAEKPTDLKPVTHALEEGRWLLGCVDARLKHEPLPERRLPCFFDPSHGPSAEDIEWAPPGGTVRTVPACAADALRVKNGGDPNIRTVPVGDDERRPYWDAGPAYSGWAGGYFGGFLPGMLMGTMLGSAMADPVYVDGGMADAGAGGDGGGDFGGGFDGGGFGGGFDGGF